MLPRHMKKICYVVNYIMFMIILILQVIAIINKLILHTLLFICVDDVLMSSMKGV